MHSSFLSAFFRLFCSSLSVSDMYLNVPRSLAYLPLRVDFMCHHSLQASSEETSLTHHGSSLSFASERSPPVSQRDACPSTDLPADDSLDQSRPHPPTPPPRRTLGRSGGSFRLPCLTKQDSHEKPILATSGSQQDTHSSDQNLMSRIAASLRFAPIPALAVAGLTPGGDITPSPQMNRQNHVPLHRASYHGHSKYAPEMNGIEFQNYLQRANPEERVIGSAENLVGRVLQEQGLGRYCDPEFVKATQRELAEAINMTPEELDRAAHRLLQAESQSSNPYLYQPMSSEEDSPYHVPKTGLQQNEGFLLSLQDDNRPHSQQNYHTDGLWDNKHLGDTRL